MSQNICQKYDICFSLQFIQDVSLMEESEVFQLFGFFFHVFVCLFLCLCGFLVLLLVCGFLGVLGVVFWFFLGGGVGWLVG